MRKKSLVSCLLFLCVISIQVMGCGHTTPNADSSEAKILTQSTSGSIPQTDKTVTETSDDSKQSAKTSTEVAKEVKPQPELIASSYGVDFYLSSTGKSAEQILLINSCIEQMNGMTKQERYRFFIDNVVHEKAMHELVSVEPEEYDTTDETKVISYLLHMEFLFTERNMKYSNKTAEQLTIIKKILNEYVFTSMSERKDLQSVYVIDQTSDWETMARACMVSVEFYGNTNFDNAMKNKLESIQTPEERKSASDATFEEHMKEMENYQNMTEEERAVSDYERNSKTNITAGYKNDDGETVNIRMTGNYELIDSFNNFIDLNGNIIDSPVVMDKEKLCGVSL